jgi:hypothetical protein
LEVIKNALNERYKRYNKMAIKYENELNEIKKKGEFTSLEIGSSYINKKSEEKENFNENFKDKELQRLKITITVYNIFFYPKRKMRKLLNFIRIGRRVPRRNSNHLNLYF